MHPKAPTWQRKQLGDATVISLEVHEAQGHGGSGRGDVQVD